MIDPMPVESEGLSQAEQPGEGPMRFAKIVFSVALGMGSVPVHGASVTDLAWLAGCWQPEGSEAGSTEQWTAPAGGTMFGVSRTIASGETVAFEFLQIREGQTGQLEYIARPSNQEEAAFRLSRLERHVVEFENLEHDFPQRIVYRLEERDRLKAHVEGERNGKIEAIPFPMHRIRCGS